MSLTTTLPEKHSLLQYSPVYANRKRPVNLKSELLKLGFTSDVNDPNPLQFERAQLALEKREEALANGWDGKTYSGAEEYFALCQQIVDTHLEERAAYFKEESHVPFEDWQRFAAEGRDTFLVIKFMDEERNIRSTVDSLLSQKGIDPQRVVIVGVDNNSQDRSGEIFKDMQEQNTSGMEMVYVKQLTPGGGSAARIGVDRCLATINAMSKLNDDPTLLHRAYIAVSDGDTIYHPYLVADGRDTFDNVHDVNGIMPFLIYKVSSCLRLFKNYVQENPEDLAGKVSGMEGDFVETNISLAAFDAQQLLPRQKRKQETINGIDGMAIETTDGDSLFVPFIAETDSGKKFGVLKDSDDNKAYIFDDRFLILEKAPVSGVENTLVFLENNGVDSENIWRWHTLIGHDIFLKWAFAGMGLSEDLILPDTSDALKGFRAWAFAVGGQHQLSNLGENISIVTGTDYQSGRVVKCFGGRVVLGSPDYHSETEIDRLTKMLLNFNAGNFVFYGNVHAGSIARASGDYHHMKGVQGPVEAEVRDYDESFFKEVAFPERVIFPLRWMIQNFICSYAVTPPDQRDLVSQSSFDIMLPDVWQDIRSSILTDEVLSHLTEMDFDALQDKGEKLAEEIIKTHWKDLMSFYKDTLQSFFQHHEVAEDVYNFLLEPMSECHEPMLGQRAMVDVRSVWTDRFRFNEKSQVVGMEL